MSGATTRQLDVLLVSERPLWPLEKGYCVHGYHVARELAAIGLRTAVCSIEPPPSDVPTELRRLSVPWPAAGPDDVAAFERGWSGRTAPLRRRLAAYLTRSTETLAGLVRLVRIHRPAAVIGLGLHAPILLAGLNGRNDVRTAWYGADELLRFHLSCMRRETPRQIARRLPLLAEHLALERLFLPRCGGAIGVNPTDTRMFQWITGARDAVTARNGVDLERFSPRPEPPRSDSLVFWGSMDFEPNIDAMRWFVRRIWPQVRRRRPGATLSIVGRDPVKEIIALHGRDGVEVLGRVEDVRPHARRAAAVVLPMRCGGGIKNKLLEAAAMGRPILASPLAVQGLELPPDRPAMALCRNDNQWIDAIQRVWSDAGYAADLGAAARRWAEREHSWRSTARTIAAWLGLDLPATAARSPMAEHIDQRAA